LSRLGLALATLHLLTFGGLVLWQFTQGHWFMSLDNFRSSVRDIPGSNDQTLPTFNYSRMVSLVLFDPIKEEIVFRGCVFTVMITRTKSKRQSILLANFLFGLFHLINLIPGQFSFLYVTFQLVLGVEMGIFYSTRLVHSGSLWEGIVLHCLNNALAVWLPTAQADLLGNALLLPCLLISMSLYLVVDVMALQQIDNKDNK
jgi:membrane protease YdiL (CAAX protease family)